MAFNIRVNFTGYGVPCTNRTAWDRLGVLWRDDRNASIQAAERLLVRGVPNFPLGLYLAFNTNGTRASDPIINARHRSLHTFALAECFEFRGRFIEPFQNALVGILNDPTWSFAAHDTGLFNFANNPNQVVVDLVSTALGANMGQALYLLNDLIGPSLITIARAKLHERVTRPIIDTIRGIGFHKVWWMRHDNNWNPVCWYGVLHTAFTTLLRDADGTRSATAMLAAEAIRSLPQYLKSFTSDGFATEGVSYYNYGFSRYAGIRELLYQASGGFFDLFSQSKVASVGTTPARGAMRDGVVAAFGDARTSEKFEANLVSYLNWAFGVRDGVGRQAPPWSPNTDLPGIVFRLFLSLDDRAVWRRPAFDIPASQNNPLRGWFPAAATLVMRASPDAPQWTSRLEMTIKGGGNLGSHNHNDLGSYVILCDGLHVLGDPGGPLIYNSSTFDSNQRYGSPLLNSYGHPVPYIMNQLQMESSRVLNGATLPVTTFFSETVDTYSVDMTTAYPSGAGVRSVTRNVVYSRVAQGRIYMNDTVVFRSGNCPRVGRRYHPGDGMADVGGTGQGFGEPPKLVFAGFERNGIPFDLFQYPGWTSEGFTETESAPGSGNRAADSTFSQFEHHDVTADNIISIQFIQRAAVRHTGGSSDITGATTSYLHSVLFFTPDNHYPTTPHLHSNVHPTPGNDNNNL
ncbi:hypothetical protein HDU96_005824 [Phlyctochytrium bullatum]|nr:hypothetical protein HDU96_005824 [Phlyctochytrium bullatum]